MKKATTTEKQTLDPETAEKVLAADLGNVLKQVKAGIPLTARQRALVESHATPQLTPAVPQMVNSLSEVARALDVSRQLLSAHSRKPDAPRPTAGRHDVQAWRNYLAAIGRVLEDDVASGTGQARERLLNAQAKREELRLRKERGELVEKSEVVASLERVMPMIFRALNRHFCNDLPPLLLGLNDPVQIRVKCLEVIKQLKGTLRAELSKLD